MTTSTSRRALDLGGLLCAIAAILSIGISLGIPGLGWLAGGLVLMIAGLLAPLVRKRYSAFVFAVTVVHLFTVGPLSMTRRDEAEHVQLSFLLIFVAMPFVVAIIPVTSAALIALWKSKAARR